MPMAILRMAGGVVSFEGAVLAVVGRLAPAPLVAGAFAGRPSSAPGDPARHVASARALAALALHCGLAALNAGVAVTRAIRHGIHRGRAVRRLNDERRLRARAHLRPNFSHHLDGCFAGRFPIGKIAGGAEILREAAAGCLEIAVDLSRETLQVDRRREPALELAGSGSIELELLPPVEVRYCV